MDAVTVKKEELLAKLRENREAHRALFNEAMDGFRERAEAELERRLEDVRRGRQIELQVGLVPPRDHTKDYDRVILMVEMSIDDRIVLSARDFASYVMDDWQWKQDFLSTSAMYTEVRA